jgi:hypothetical protein
MQGVEMFARSYLIIFFAVQLALTSNSFANLGVTISLPSNTFDEVVTPLSHHLQGLQVGVRDEGWRTSTRLAVSDDPDFTPYSTLNKSFALSFEVHDTSGSITIPPADLRAIDQISDWVCSNIYEQVSRAAASDLQEINVPTSLELHESTVDLQSFSFPANTNAIRAKCHLRFRYSVRRNLNQ